jgi:hypothetical protein
MWSAIGQEMTPCLAIPAQLQRRHNHRLDHATSQDRTIRLKALPHDDQTETRRARRSAGNVYTLDCEEPVSQDQTEASRQADDGRFG